MRFRFTLSTLVALAAFTAAPAHAQCMIDSPTGGSCQLPHSVRATANTVATLSLNSSVTTLSIGAIEYENGTAPVAGPNLTVAANANWVVTVASSANTWTGPTGTAKPSTDLEVSSVTVSTPVSTTPVQILTGTPQAAATIPSVILTRWNYATDPPGIYNIDLIFTLTAP